MSLKQNSELNKECWGANLSYSRNQDQNSRLIIDRTCIPVVPKDDQNYELYKLGIDIYEQADLEKGIFQLVDKCFAKPNQNGSGNEFLDSDERSENIQKIETLTKNKSQVTDQNNDIGSINFAHYGLKETKLERKVRMGETTPFGSQIDSSIIEEKCYYNVEKYLQYQTEAQRKKKGVKKKSSALNKLVQNQDQKMEKNEGKNKSFMGSNVKETSSLLHRHIFNKRKKQSKYSRTNMNLDINDQERNSCMSSTESVSYEESSCSDYIPSESGISGDEGTVGKFITSVKKSKKKKVSKKIKLDHEGKWNTDDSDWDYSDDETYFKARSIKGRKEQDDGDYSHYMRRLSFWEKHNNREEIEMAVKCLDGGFKVPLIVWSRLFNYQKVGVQWLWELNIQRCGGILGDEMGLGKTVQIIAFLSGLSVSKLLSRHGSFKGLGPVLIVTPTTVMHQWIKEFHDWWPQLRAALMHESGNYNGERRTLIHEIVKTNGILVTSFVGCMQQIAELTKYVWHYIILDEGHKIRNPDSQITNAVKQIKTPHRLILSGSPMQNNLKELWSLFDFIFPGKLGTLPVFMSEFAVPITQGGYTNASQVQIATGYKCATVLRDTISPYLLRRVKDDVKNHINLPMKNEQVLFCKLTEEQRKLYLEYLNSKEVDSILSGRYKIFVGLINLRKICNHPHLYNESPKNIKRENADSAFEDEKFGEWKKAGKMIVLETLLKIWKKQDHRVLIFTQSRKMLHIIENFIQLQSYEYLKLDGSTCIGSRQPVIRKFNEDKKYFIFLCTTRVGGLGINLTGADRVVIYDPDWNPATDTQARERAWRIGQTNQVTIYRLVTSGTIEEKIYHRQIFKQFLTNKVLKDPKQRRFFKSNDLYELFTLKDEEAGITETSALFAGSGSEVNLESITKKMKEKHKHSKSKQMKLTFDTSTLLNKKKIEKMRKLAKFLSKKISNGLSDTQSTGDEAKIITQNLSSIRSAENTEKDVLVGKVKSAVHRTPKKSYASYSKEKKRNTIHTFEGKAVPYLVNKLEYKECYELENEYKKEQDDYILGKLFSKSGIKTAMQHDRIMEEGPADYALVEGEAEKVAKAAVRALKESRKEYFQSVTSPCIALKPRFGIRTRKKISEVNNEDGNRTMSSSELLSRMKERNRLTCNNDSILSTDSSNEQLQLLTDIRNFVSSEAQVNNIASTQEIIERFKDRLPAGTSPVFRALLLEICEFHRDIQGKGMWKLRPDLN